ncbi:MAG: hypothetical protein H0W09_04225, partial [Solirubrobacterales bacterium]|nr:hypothetical protein [Solirubrobacterales bacterium]
MESATISRPEEARRAGAGAEGLRSVAVPVVIWAALIAVGWLVGTVLNDAGTVIMLDAPPLYGDWDLRYGPGVLIPVGVGAALVAG